MSFLSIRYEAGNEIQMIIYRQKKIAEDAGILVNEKQHGLEQICMN